MRLIRVVLVGAAAIGSGAALGCSDNNAAPDGGGQAGGGGSDATQPSMSFGFANGMDGFALDTFANAGPYTGGNPQNIGGVPNGAGTPAVTFDGAEGMPSSGSARITATFNDFNQTVTVRQIYQPTQTIDLAGKTVTAEVRLDAGGTFTGTVHLMALSSPSPPNPAPGYYFAQGDSIRLVDNDWHVLRFQMSAPEFAATGWQATDIVQIGVQLASGFPPASGVPTDAGSGGGAGSDGGTTDGAAAVPPTGNGDGGVAGSAYGAPQSISVHFDTMEWN
jgi:hypothetical protein